MTTVCRHRMPRTQPHLTKGWWALLLTAFITCATSAAWADAQRAFPGEYVVTFSKHTASQSGIATSAARSIPRKRAHVLQNLTSEAVLIGRPGRTSALSLDGEELRQAAPIDPADTFCKDLIADGIVRSCSPNFELKASEVVPNDPKFGDLWGLANMEASKAWEVSTGSSQTVVAVIDTGVDYNHPDLRDNIWVNPGEIPGNGQDDDVNGVVDDVYGFNAITGAAAPGNPMDDNMHGTHVAGTIGAVGNNSVGVVGINHSVKIMGLKFLNGRGSGSLGDAIRAIGYLVKMKRNHGVNVRVVNNSWGGGGYSQALDEAIVEARDADIIFVAAAGNESNDNDNSPSYPASYEHSNVVSVAAIDEQNNIASFSNYGATSVDIAAPGVSILSTTPDGQYASLSGTSMASPHVAGALALLLTAEPSLSTQDAIARLYETGQTLATLVSGSVPLVRTQRAVNLNRLMRNERSPVPDVGNGGNACGYDLQVGNLLATGSVDTSADNEPIVVQADEGSFYELRLPFQFPFFRGTTDTLYLSPNGVAYTAPPRQIDYQVGSRAPANSIAPLHYDLIPTKAHHGVRAFVSSERVTIAWVGELYSKQGEGEAYVRLTIFPSGLIQTSVSFGTNGELSDLRAKALGNPFVNEVIPASAVVGITGQTSQYTSSVDLGAAQKMLLSSADAPLVLGVTMTSSCGAENDAPPTARVTAIALRQSAGAKSKSNAKLGIILAGEGTGAVPLTASVNGVACSQGVQAPLTSGYASLETTLPRLPVRVTLSSGGVSKSVKVRSKRVMSRRAVSQKIDRICRTILSSIRERSL